MDLDRIREYAMVNEMNRIERKLENIIALSPQQLGMLLQYLANPKSKLNLEQISVELIGDVDYSLFAKAWRMVCMRHSTLRTTFRWQNLQQPVQVIMSTYDPVRHSNDGTLDEQFDLQEVPFDVSLDCTSTDHPIMKIRHHHILFDGWSAANLLKDFLWTYRGLAGNEFQPLARYSSYKPYIQFLRKLDAEKHKIYWDSYLEGYSSQPRQRFVQHDTTEQLTYRMDSDLYESIRRYVKEEQLTLPTLVYAAWGALLSALYQTEDVCFDTTISTRSDFLDGIEGSIGLYINSLPVRLKIKSGCTAREAILSVKHDMIERLDYRYLSIKDKGNRTGLLHSLVVVENYPVDEELRLLQDGLRYDNVSFNHQTGYNLALLIFPNDTDLTLSCHYKSNSIQQDHLKELMDLLSNILWEIITYDGQEMHAVLNRHVRGLDFVTNLRSDIEESKIILPQIPMRNANEEAIARIWADVLRVDHATLGSDSDFFELNGHSLDAAFAVSKIANAFQIIFNLSDIFRLRTIGAISEHISSLEQQLKGFMIEKAPNKKRYLASYAQRRIYISQQLYPDSTAYNVCAAFRLRGEISVETIRKAFINIVTRHEALRTVFAEIDGDLYQIIKDEIEFELSIVQANLQKDSTEFLQRYIQPFRLEEGSLIRGWLIRLEQDQYILFIDMHHIISDGVTTSVLIDELSRLYKGEQLSIPFYQYADYSEWQRSTSFRQNMLKQEKYWLKAFDGRIPMFNAPIDYKRGDTMEFSGDIVKITLDNEQSAWIRETALREGTTPFVVLLCLCYLLFHKVSGDDSIIIGVPVANRSNAAFESTVGMFVNMLPIQTDFDGIFTFRDILQRVANKVLSAFDHQDYPFDLLIEKLPIRREPARHPLFDIVFLYQNVRMPSLDFNGMTVEPMIISRGTAKFDLMITGTENNQIIELEFEYKTALFREETITYLAQYYMRLLNSLKSGSRQSII